MSGGVRITDVLTEENEDEIAEELSNNNNFDESQTQEQLEEQQNFQQESVLEQSEYKQEENIEKSQEFDSVISENQERQAEIEKEQQEIENINRQQIETNRQMSIEKRSRSSSVVSENNNHISKQLSSRSVTFEKPQSATRRSYSNLSNVTLIDPYLTSINDLKYLGDQFVVGKMNPNLKQPHEERFQKMFQARAKKLMPKNNLTSSSLNRFDLSDFKRTKDPKTLPSDLTLKYSLTNDMKYIGEQFKVGKLTKDVSPFERKFQEKFKNQLKYLMPSQSKLPMRPLNFDQLREVHNSLALPRRPISSK